MKIGELVYTNLEIWDKENYLTLDQDFTILFTEWLKENKPKKYKLNDQEYITKISKADVIKWAMIDNKHILIFGVFLNDKKKQYKSNNHSI